VALRQVRDERHAAQLHLVAIVQNLVDRVTLAARHHLFECWHILGHRHDRCAGELLDERIAFHVIRMRVAAEDDLDVGVLEASCSMDPRTVGTFRS
jgi:hypothetical protein